MEEGDGETFSRKDFHGCYLLVSKCPEPRFKVCLVYLGKQSESIVHSAVAVSEGAFSLSLILHSRLQCSIVPVALV